MNNFNSTLQSHICAFIKNHNHVPNEVFLGQFEKRCLEYELNNNINLIKPNNKEVYIKDYDKLEYMGLKIRFTEQISKMEVMYNPHYE